MSDKHPFKVSSSRYQGEGESEITLTGDKNIIDNVESALIQGTMWMKCNKDNLIFTPAYKTPTLEIDSHIDPFFKKSTLRCLAIKKETDNIKKKDNTHDSRCSFYVQHLQGYNGCYESVSRSMENAGFECLRSRRGKDGKIWEIWYLADICFFKCDKKKVSRNDVISFLQHLGVGQFEIAEEHWGLGVD
jgi:hypothetical protein